MADTSGASRYRTRKLRQQALDAARKFSAVVGRKLSQAYQLGYLDGYKDCSNGLGPIFRLSSKVREKPLTIHEMRQAMIQEALRRHEGNRAEAAETLGIGKRTLYRWLKEIPKA